MRTTRDVRRVAAEVLAKHDSIDVLVNNAGGLLMDRQVTKDGDEATFATNHLGYFLLTKLLLDAVNKAPAGRIVNVASAAGCRAAWGEHVRQCHGRGPTAAAP